MDLRLSVIVSAALARWTLPVVTGLVVLCFMNRAESAPAAGAPPPVLIVAGNVTPPVQHGLDALKLALERHGSKVSMAPSNREAAGPVVVAGIVPGDGEAAQLATKWRCVPGRGPESLVIRRSSSVTAPVILAAGSDARGLMYALLELADRVSCAPSADRPFSLVADLTEQPFTPERALSIYTFNRAWWEKRFYDESYWARYLDLLARNRFNSLVVIFGYENGGFLAPCYPYFFNVEGFPDVRMTGIEPAEQARNLAALNRLITMAHDRGIRFTAGIWDHIYRGGVQGGGIPGADEAVKRPLPGLVWGVTATNLVPYTKAALAEFVRRTPGLDGIQFRMHDESGLKDSEQAGFWRDVFVAMKQQAPGLRLDLRAKGLPDSVIQSAQDTGVPFRITTKYWMEQMGLPFHPTHINTPNQLDRRHSYADMLRYPQRYSMHWRLWNGGTSRVLLWGDPDYARRFAQSSRLYDGDGFEVNEPLCTKMEAQPHDAQPFDLLSPERRYYDYEFERYWHFFQVFGRLGYNPSTPAGTWRHEFLTRFGPAAAPSVEKGLHLASGVLPRIVASCYPYGAFPMTRGWAEKQRLGDLPAYARAEGSDIAIFASFDEEAKLLLENGATAKTRPAETSRWFAQRASNILAQAAQAAQQAGPRPNREVDSTLTDLKILAGLAQFHARRIPAAVSYRLFERTGDPAALDDAITAERHATAAWKQLVADAGDFYAPDLMMGVRGASLCGHWRDELAALEKGCAALERRRAELKAPASGPKAPRYTPESVLGSEDAPRVIHPPVTTAPAGRPIAISARIASPADIKWVRVRYRNVNQHQDYRTVEMKTVAPGRYHALIPADATTSTWDVMYFIEVMDARGAGKIHPDFNRETPYIIVKLQR